MLTLFKLFLCHLRGKGVLIAGMLLLGLAGAATSLATPLIGKTFIDAIVGKGDYAKVPHIALALIVLALIDFVLGGVTRLVHTKLSTSVLMEIRERLFKQCLSAPLAELERFRHGDLLNRFGSDIPKIQTLLVDGVLGIFQNILFLVVAATILLRLSVSLTLWSFLGILVALVISASFRKPVEKGTRVVRDAMVDISHFLAERLNALRAVRLHAAQLADREVFSEHNAALVHRLMKFQALDSAATGFPTLMLTVSLAWIYLLGGRLIESGEISLGTFVAFVLYQGRLISPAMGLLGLVRNLQEVRVSLERVSEVLANEAEACGLTVNNELKPRTIVFRDVSFAYADSPVTLDRLNLQVSPGERIAILGPSGTGKSTLVQILFGLRIPQMGRVEIGGADAELSIREMPGYAGCDPFLMHATVAENLRYGNHGITDIDLRLAACLAEAHDFISGLPNGYDTIVGGRGMALSDGQRQRIGIARLILSNPGILVLDEAFSALDPETEAKIRRNLFGHFPASTFLMITHHLQGLDAFDRLYLMQRGQLHQVNEFELRTRFRDEPHQQKMSCSMSVAGDENPPAAYSHNSLRQIINKSKIVSLDEMRSLRH